MADQVANLQIRVGSDQVSTAEGRLNRLTQTGAKAERATDGLTSAFVRLAGPLAGFISITAGLTKLVSTQREFDKLNAGLITATGSAENATVAFAAIQQFATDTPFDLAQVTDSFIKLVNYGLTPSERALTSYGDTSSALGKDLNQMIEAVADAVTFQFERLKEFGIKASKEGDRVKFTFRGITTEVGANARDIENYLINLGETNFGGAMEQRMKTLDGALSNLGDEWDKLFLNISQSGTGDLISQIVDVAIDALSELNAMLASGQMEGYLRAVGAAWTGWGSDISTTLGMLRDKLNDWQIDGTSSIDFFIDAMMKLPENVRAMVQIIAVDLATSTDVISAYATAIKDSLKAVFTDDTQDAVAARLQQRLTDLGEVREESINEIMAERQAAIDSFDAQIAKAKQLREEFDKKPKAQGDQLERFGIKAPTNNGPTDAEKKAAEKAAEARKKAFEDLVDDLRTEEEAIQESYDKRLKIITDNTKAGSEQQQELMRRLQAERDSDLQDLVDKKNAERDSLYNGLLSEEEALKRSYEKRKKDILESTSATIQEKIDLMQRLEQQYSDEQAAIEKERMAAQFSAAESLFDGLASLAKDYAGEQSGAYRALFAVSKAFSVAQAIMSIQTGLAKAQELGFPANLAEMARVAATGAGILATINGSNFAGAFDSGGLIPAGKIGLVGERGPELVRGPANVTSRKDTERLMQGAAAPAQPPVVNIRNINVLDPSVVGSYLATDEGELLIMNVVQKNKSALSA